MCEQADKRLDMGIVPEAQQEQRVKGPRHGEDVGQYRATRMRTKVKEVRMTGIKI